MDICGHGPPEDVTLRAAHLKFSVTERLFAKLFQIFYFLYPHPSSLPLKYTDRGHSQTATVCREKKLSGLFTFQIFIQLLFVYVVQGESVFVKKYLEQLCR